MMMSKFERDFSIATSRQQIGISEIRKLIVASGAQSLYSNPNAYIYLIDPEGMDNYSYIDI